MVEVIKSYQSKIGEVTLKRYEEDGKVEFHVEHSNPLVSSQAWYNDRYYAVRDFQFLCAWSDRQII